MAHDFIMFRGKLKRAPRNNAALLKRQRGAGVPRKTLEPLALLPTLPCNRAGRGGQRRRARESHLELVSEVRQLEHRTRIG